MKKKNTFIAILRGINVSGKNLIKMSDLVRIFESMGFENVSTYLQSGNVIFETDSSSHIDLQKQITSQIKQDLDLNVPVIVFGSEYIAQVCENNPFVKLLDTDVAKLYVTFLSEVPEHSGVEKIHSDQYLPDAFVMEEKVVYLNCIVGYGKTKLSNNFFENKLKVTATTRNWNTVNKLAELSEEDK